MKSLSLFLAFSLFLMQFSGCEKSEALGVPACVRDEIKTIESDPVSNPPRSVWQYTYKEKVVYYIPSMCCDIPSRLLDVDCNIICSPDGGITGTGDEKCADFFATRKNERLIWEDKRK